MANENFTILDGELISYSGDDTIVTVPDGVKSIKEGAFLGCVHIKEVKLPEGLTIIKHKAFWGCARLKKIKLPNTLRTIEFGAFRECESLGEITIPDGVTVMGDSVFRSCDSLAKVYLPDSLNELRTSTFSDCFLLSDIRLPETLERIPVSCFEGCACMKSITIPESVKTIGKNAFSGCTSLANVKLPSGLKVIEKECFEDCKKLMKLDVPDSIEYIGANAFNKSGLLTYCFSDYLIMGHVLVRYMGKDETTAIPNGVCSISDHAFANNEELKNITFPETVTEIHDNAFEGCPLLKSVELPHSLKTIGDGVFTDCESLFHIEFPPNIERIGKKVFSGTGFEKYNRDELNILSGKYLISYSGTTDELSIPAGVRVIADEAFVECGGVNSVTLPYGLKTIGDGAFQWRSELKKISIPSTVNYIGENAFASCHEPDISIINPKARLCENGFPDGARLRIVDGTKVLNLKLKWGIKAGDCPERRMWNFVCGRSSTNFALLDKPEYKIPCAIFYYDVEEYCKDYINRNIVEAVCFAASQEDDYILERVLSFRILDNLQLQECINYAIEHKLTVQQLTLMRYRFENLDEPEAK